VFKFLFAKFKMYLLKPIFWLTKILSGSDEFIATNGEFAFFAIF